MVYGRGCEVRLRGLLGATPTMSVISPLRPRTRAGTGCSCGSRCGASMRGSRSGSPRAHLEDPARHTAHPTVTTATVGAGRPGRHRRSPVERAGHALGRVGCGRLGLRNVRRGVRPAHQGGADGRVPRHRVRAVGRPAVHLRRHPLPRGPNRVPHDRQRRAGTAGPDLVCRGAWPRTSRSPERCVGTG